MRGGSETLPRRRSYWNSFTDLSLSEAALQPVCIQPFHLQHTVYNLCYKSSEHADYRLYKPRKALLSEFQAWNCIQL